MVKVCQLIYSAGDTGGYLIPFTLTKLYYHKLHVLRSDKRRNEKKVQQREREKLCLSMQLRVQVDSFTQSLSHSLDLLPIYCVRAFSLCIHCERSDESKERARERRRSEKKAVN